MEEKYFTTRQVAEHLNVTEQFVRAQIRRGRLHANWLGKEYRISPEDLEAYKKLTHTSERNKGDLVEV